MIDDELDDPFAESKPYTSSAETFPSDRLKYTGTLCVDCHKPQYNTESGITCENGHGGAESLPDDGTDPFGEEEPGPPAVVTCLHADTAFADPASTLKVIYDSEMMATLDEETGEILSVEGAPPDTAEIIDIAKWLGERLTWSEAKAAGVKAEKQVWIDKINSQFDPEINSITRYHDYLVKLYTPILERYAWNAVFDKDGNTTGKSKTVKMGLLRMSFTTTRPRIDLIQQDDTIEIIRGEIAALKEDGNTEEAARLSAAIKVSRSLLKSVLPLDYMMPLEPDEYNLFASEDGKRRLAVPLKEYLQKKSLVNFYAGGEQEFKLK